MTDEVSVTHDVPMEDSSLMVNPGSNSESVDMQHCSVVIIHCCLALFYHDFCKLVFTLFNVIRPLRA